MARRASRPGRFVHVKLNAAAVRTLVKMDATNSGFTSPATPIIPTGNTPISIGIGDFNGDGRNDIAVGNETDSTVSLFYADPSSDSGFSDGPTIPISFTDVPYVTSIAVGDLGNGHPDIAVTVAGYNDADSSEPGELVLLMNDGHGNFTQTALPTGSDPKDVVIGDLGNGRPDLAVAAQGTGNGVFDPGVDLFLSNGRGGYTAQTLSTSAGFQEPQSVAIGDLNGDGRPDLVTANLGSVPGTVTVFLNQGRGNYSQTTLPAGDFPSPRPPFQPAPAQPNS